MDAKVLFFYKLAYKGEEDQIDIPKDLCIQVW